MSQYTDFDFCPQCDIETQQTIKSADHERDSSNDTQTCLVCGWWKSFQFDEWNPPATDEEE
jgi:hypothetical protein